MENNKNTQGHKLPTAEEFWLSKRPLLTHAQIAIEFAKLHVQKALEQASENAQLYHNNEYLDEFDDPSGLVTIAKDTILESYPLTNIK